MRICKISVFSILILFTVSFASGASATKSILESEGKIFDHKIEQDLESKYPQALADFEQGNRYYEKGDFQRALPLFQKVAAMAPGFSHAKRRICTCERQLGQRDLALQHCREALAVEASIENRLALAGTLIDTKEEATDAEKREASTLLREAAISPRMDAVTLMIAAEVALKVQDFATLDSIVPPLLQKAPQEMGANYYAALLSWSKGDFSDARGYLKKSYELGLPRESYVALDQAIVRSEPWYLRFLAPGAWIVGGWLLGIAILVSMGAVLSHLTLLSVAGVTSAVSGSATSTESWIKKLYGTVLWLCCAYYYFSIPLVLFSVILTFGGIIFLFFAVGRIPVKLVAILAIIGITTIVSIIKSLFASIPDEDPGKRLDLQENDRLRAVLRDVAEAVGTKPVDRVFLTPGVDMAVYERGGMMEQLRGKAERCLIFGVGLADDWKVGELRSVLAHEYGHLVNKDTAGGSFALAVRRSLVRMGHELAISGNARWYNPAWWFLQGFFRVFLRISHGASRLQEILADRWAAIAYGSENFVAGLKHVIERQVRFDAHVNSTLKEVFEQRKALLNLYQYQPGASENEADIEKQIAEGMNRKPSAYDSHPSPRDRFALVTALKASGDRHPPDAEEAVWSLFANREQIQEDMTRVVHRNLEQYHGISFSADGTPILQQQEPAAPNLAGNLVKD